ncbi:hypothetical protein ACFL3G_12865 [Planctomycetota bacterium]
MGTSNIKNVLGKLSFIREYSSLVVPVVIALVAVLVFVPAQLMGNKFKGYVTAESISKRGNRIDSLKRNAVSRQQWREERKYQDAYKADAEKISQLATQSSERELLSYSVFPKPKEKSRFLFELFGKKYRDGVDGMLEVANACECPTETELEDALLRSPQASRRSRSYKDGLNYVTDAIVDELCKEKAQSASVYAAAEELGEYESWDSYQFTSFEKAINDCWYSQLGYWIVEDVITTIEEMNSGSQSVFTSPVKRLLSVSFGYGEKKKTKTNEEITNRPVYVRSTGEGLVNSYTGRVCGDSVDVVHFNLSVVVSAKSVLPFMAELCKAKEHRFMGWDGQAAEQRFRHNQIAILVSEVSAISTSDGRGDKDIHELYRYGDEDAVVQLSLVCEYVFNKKGYDAVNPQALKGSLEVADDKKSGRKAISGRKTKRR